MAAPVLGSYSSRPEAKTQQYLGRWGSLMSVSPTSKARGKNETKSCSQSFFSGPIKIPLRASFKNHLKCKCFFPSGQWIAFSGNCLIPCSFNDTGGGYMDHSCCNREGQTSWLFGEKWMVKILIIFDVPEPSQMKLQVAGSIDRKPWRLL